MGGQLRLHVCVNAVEFVDQVDDLRRTLIRDPTTFPRCVTSSDFRLRANTTSKIERFQAKKSVVFL